MHGFSSGSSLLVNAEVDSMGGIVDSGVGISTETSPRQAAIVKTQDELRLEYDVREERRRELEFLEKGGNLLDFKFGVVAPVSVQSSSLADQLQCQFRTCEAKGSISLAASPHGDSIGSSGRKGTTVACEPNSADNFDGENELFGIEGKSTYATRSSIVPSENSSHLDGSQNVKKSENSPNLQPKKAYRRRNRSKTNRDSARSSSTGIGFNGGHKSSLFDHHGLLSMGVHESPLDIEMDGLHAAPAGPTNGGLAEAKLQNIEDVRDSTATASVEPNPSTGRELAACEVNEFPTCSGAEKPESDGAAKQLRESDHFKGDEKCSQTDGIVSSIVVTLKGLDSESSCTQTSVSADRNGNIDSGLSTSLKNVDSIEEQKEQKLPLKQTANNNNNNNEKLLPDNKAADVVENDSCMNDNHFSQNHQASVVSERDEGGTGNLQFVAEYEAQYMPSAKPLQSNNHTNTTLSVKVLSDNTIHTSGCSSEKQQLHNPSDVLTNTDTLCSVSIPELQLCDENQTKVVDKEYEERILEEARNVNAKREIMKNISLGSMPKEYRCRSHWGFVLEEMAWMANDFAQERVWKRTAATQLCYRAAFASRLRLMEQNKYGRDKLVAQTLAKAVADFWHSAALLVGKNVNTSGYEAGEHDTATSENTNLDRNGSEGHVEEYLGKNIKLAVQEYAVRFLQHNSSILPIVKDASSGTPEKGSNIGMTDLTYHNQHTEENLFYAVPHRAMEAYRKYVERYIMQLERAGKNMHEVYKSPYEAVAEFNSKGDEFEENEGENTYYLSGAFEDSMNKSAQKKRSNPKLYSPRVGDDSSYGPCMGNRSNCPQSAVKRHVDGLDVCPIPTKRVRTASRQRVVGPFRSGATGFVSAPCRTDASSGDTNSFQDDQITEHAASFRPKGLEVESGMDYDKQASFDSAEIAVKPKKKKKTKHQAPRWQAGSGMQIEQRNNFKKRLESHHCDSNGNSGVFGPHGKKPKTVKQLMDNSFESTNLMNGSAASPVGSQMSNMSNSNKLIKLIGGRDRGRKTKLLKMPSEQTGSGNPWSVFEDQALVVLVHDMGPNWELVSDAINSTLHFKCIFRKPKECRERHRILVEKSCGDGADIEDSGSSQPYPSTLPGIPKGGARQLFQQLRGPIEEDTIKSHFEKIMLIGRELHGRKKEPRQLVPAHSSHLAALSQVITNNLNGGVLTPLDLCDMDVPSPDLFALSPHSRGLPLPNQGAVESLLSSSTISPHHGSASAQHNGTARDGRCGVPRTVHEQQRIQQYNHALSGRSTPVSGTFSANDRGGHLLSGGNGIAMSGMNRSSSMLRTGIHGGSIPSSGSVAAGQGNSVPRPHDGSHMARPGQSPDRHRQMMSSEMKMQGPHINNQGVVPAFGALTSSFPSQSASPSGSIYPVQKQQHQMPRQHSKVLSNSHHPHLQASTHLGNTEQQALAMRLARQRMLQRQQQQQQNHPQQFPASGALIPTALQSSSTVHSQAASQPVSLPPLMTPSSPVTPGTSQQQQKRQIGTSTIVNQGGKLRQHQGQQLQQLLQKSGKHHPPQGQPSQVQQTKKLKGMGGGSMLMPKNHSIDSSHLNRVSGDPGSQLEKGDQTKTTVPSPTIQSHLSQKLYTNTAPASSKQDQRGHSHPGTTNPSQAAVVSSISAVPNSNQHISPPILLSPSHQQSKVNIQPSSKLVSDCQPTIHREVSQNCVTNSGPLADPQNEQREADEKKLANGTSSMSTTSRIPSICTKSANGIPLASSACSEQRETLEPTSPNAQLPSIGSPSMSNPSSNEPVAPVSQVLDAQQLSHSLGSHGST